MTSSSSKQAQTAATPKRDEGLIQFYSSEAEALLAQFRRIDYLLGPESKEHTHSGTLCEVLLRDYLRRVCLPWMGVDKGFVYGKSEDGESAECSPEIDILIHDQKEYRPIFRMEDFVIVQPESVLGIIQVKKRLNTSGTDPLKKGLVNVMSTKRHLLTQILQRRGHGITVDKACKRVLVAVVGFEGKTQPKTYWERLDSVIQSHADFRQTFTDSIPASFFLLPHIVGTLDGTFCCRTSYDQNTATFKCFNSIQSDQNVFCQVFADILSNILWGDQILHERRPPFQYPSSIKEIGQHDLN